MNWRARGVLSADNMPWLRCYLAGKHRFDASNNHSANQNNGERFLLRIKHTNSVLIVSKQVWNLSGGHLIDGKQPAWHINHFTQCASQRHVHTVIIPWR